MRFLLPPFLFLDACAGGGPGGGPLPAGVDCETVACNLGDEVFCGDPQVRIGTGFSEFEPILNGEMPIVFSSFNGLGACGYHLSLGFETEQMCPIIRLDYEVHLLGIDGGAIADGTRAIQFVREDEGSSVQQIWATRAFIPQEYYPRDPAHADVCPGDQKLPCDESQFLVRVEVEDLTGRFASVETVFDPVCCN
jgi:hypothetical protein